MGPLGQELAVYFAALSLSFPPFLSPLLALSRALYYHLPFIPYKPVASPNSPPVERVPGAFCQPSDAVLPPFVFIHGRPRRLLRPFVGLIVIAIY